MMKKLIRYVSLAAVLALCAFRCSDDEQLAIQLEVRPQTISADGKSQARFTVFEGNADVTGQSVIRSVETGDALQGDVFSTEIAGEYHFYAEYDGRKTNSVKVEAQPVVESAFVRNVCLMEFTDAQCPFCPDASRYIDFNILQNQNYDYVHLMAFHEKDKWAIEQYAVLRSVFEISATPYAVVDMREGSSLETGKRDEVKTSISTSRTGYPSHCGLAMTSSVTGASANVSVKLLSEKSAEYRLALYVVEDGLKGPQLDGSLTNENYYHSFVVRRLVSETVYGDNLGRVNQNEEATKEYAVSVDPSWNLAKTYVYALAMDKDGYVNNMQVCLLDSGTAGYQYVNQTE